jgi:tRNA(Arg) A34 adenosine deaminase TadA
MLPLLLLAAKVANPSIDRFRKAILGCVVVRSDGAVVSSRNGSTPMPWGTSPTCHAERKAIRKSDYGATLYVARVKKTGEIAMAKPCEACMNALRSKKVKKIYYTINDQEYGVIIP